MTTSKLLVLLIAVLLCAAAPTGADEAEVKQTLEDFGSRLKEVSLHAPNIEDRLREHYSEFVVPELLARWISDPSKAPGRLVSSPWPDRMETKEMTKTGPGAYVVDAAIIEVTSIEVANGGAANTIPVRITVQERDGRWMITDFERVRQGDFPTH